ncbi:MAG: DUF2490 domain-containing protein [Bryobacteraceae bacterium]|nr:DUF2490 domain-containing protein [Bryobacteraceae bacterium]
MQPRLLPLAAFAAAAALGQTSASRTVNNHNSWYNWFGHHQIAGKFGAHTEVQFRRSGWGETWQQLLMRYGATYDLNSSLRVVVGYGYIRTYPYGEAPSVHPFPEHRIWEDLHWHRRKQRHTMLNRFRVEQRYIGLVARDSDGGLNVKRWNYENRFRWMLRETFPLGKPGSLRQGPYMTAYNEFWVNFGPGASAHWFDQNRAYLGAGYRFNRLWAMDAGYMHQIIRKRAGPVWENNHTMVVNLHCNVPLRPQ